MKTAIFLAAIALLWIVGYPAIAFMTMTTGAPDQALARPIYNAWATGIIAAFLAVPVVGLFGVIYEKLGRRA